MVICVPLDPAGGVSDEITRLPAPVEIGKVVVDAGRGNETK